MYRSRDGQLADKIQPVTHMDTISAIQREIREVFIGDPVADYLLNITRSTREHPSVMLGASPRATLSFMNAVKAYAFLHERDYVLPDDVKTLAPYVLSHRIIASGSQARQCESRIGPRVYTASGQSACSDGEIGMRRAVSLFLNGMRRLDSRGIGGMVPMSLYVLFQGQNLAHAILHGQPSDDLFDRCWLWRSQSVKAQRRVLGGAEHGGEHLHAGEQVRVKLEVHVPGLADALYDRA